MNYLLAVEARERIALNYRSDAIIERTYHLPTLTKIGFDKGIRAVLWQCIFYRLRETPRFISDSAKARERLPAIAGLPRVSP